MRALRKGVLLAAACFAAAAAGWATQAPSVDDVIAGVLKNGNRTAARTPAAAAHEALVMSARIGVHDDRTRFVVEISDPVAMRTFTLTNPNRVVIDMPSVKWHLEGPPRPQSVGAVRSYRYGAFRPGTSRFVIDLNQPVTVGEPMVLPPENGSGYRVVFDLFPVPQAKFDRASGWPDDLKQRDIATLLAALPKNPPPPQSRIKRVIVIDPGHGGLDPGTHGDDGANEKDLVLAVSHQLARVLEARGYTVRMTRDSDTAVELSQRAQIARSWRADLLISIHANWNANADIRGLSIYSLSEKGSDAEARALANKENGADKLIGVDLSGDKSAAAPILIDMAQRDTMNKSSHFAELALGELRDETDILPNKPHRDAAFMVLKAPDVPAVLIELGFLSNPVESRRMQTDGWRARVAHAIAAAVDRQFAPVTEAGPSGGGTRGGGRQ